MQCARCQGLSVKEPFDKHGAWWWRCYACGDRVDGTVLLNRAEQEAAEANRQLALDRDLKEWAR